MRRNISRWQLAGFVFVGVLGPILHFLYNWSGQNPIVAAFSAINESTWEHMKILFFPMLIFAVIESRYIERENFWCEKFIGILTGVILIPVLFYTIGGAFGETPDFVNILIYYIAAAISLALENWLFGKKSIKCSPKTTVIALIVIAVLFVIWTYIPPEIPLFQDPISGGYGI